MDTENKINLAQFIEKTFENQLNDKTINSTKIISDFLDNCNEDEVNQEDEDGFTPIEVASAYLNSIYHEPIIYDVLNVIDLLLSCGAKKTESCNTVWCTAKDYNRDDLADRI